MTTTGAPARATGATTVLTGLATASHPGPAVVVTTVAALLAVAADLPPGTTLLVTAAVLAGQLVIGWGNDLVDRRRDRAVGRTDKPVATGALSSNLVVVALVVVGAACVGLSLAAGWRTAVANVVLVVGAGQAYNLGLKATWLSWLPFAVAFGALPAVATLAGPAPVLPPWWTLLAGACLGCGAHVLNTLPDLQDDLATGVRGLPHRLGAARSRVLAAALLVGASLVVVLGPAGTPATWTWAVLVVVLALAGGALAGRGTVPFWSAAAIALVDVALLVAVSR